MKTETQVKIELGHLRAGENLMGGLELRLKVFLASSRTDSKPFKVGEEVTNVEQTLEIANIAGKELELWLCNLSDKIIANARVSLPKEPGTPQQLIADFKMTSVPFAILELTVTMSKREIEKAVWIEPDEDLLKKVEDPLEKQRLEQEQARRARQGEQRRLAAQQVKKPPITVSQFNKKEMPFS